jgi:hypothetical protein
MNATYVLTKSYEKKDTWWSEKNEPKTNPIQSQKKPISNARNNPAASQKKALLGVAPRRCVCMEADLLRSLKLQPILKRENAGARRGIY